MKFFKKHLFLFAILIAIGLDLAMGNFDASLVFGFALIKLGAIVTQISGKLGGHVFARNRGGAYMRTNATPNNPQTSFQTAVRAIMAAISSAWSGLTDVQRNSWNNATDNFSRTDQFGDIRNLSGKALFQSLNQNLQNVGENVIDTAPESLPVPNIEFVSASGDEDTQDFELEFEGDTTGSKILIFVTPPLSQGTSFVKNKLRVLTFIAGGPESTENIGILYGERFGLLVQGQNIHVGVIVVNASGQASPMTVVKSLIIGS